MSHVELHAHVARLAGATFRVRGVELAATRRAIRVLNDAIALLERADARANKLRGSGPSRSSEDAVNPGKPP